VADIDVWPISMLLMADMVFCVADMVVADVVCGRYRRFPYDLGGYVRGGSVRQSFLGALAAISFCICSRLEAAFPASYSNNIYIRLLTPDLYIHHI